MPPKVFVVSWLIGVGSGVAAAAVTMTAAVSIAMALAPTVTPEQSLAGAPLIWVAAIIAAVNAGVLAVFPIGPFAAALAWPLFRAGVASRWAYAAVGVVASLAAPALVLMLETWNPQLIRLSDLIPFRVDAPDVLAAAWFASIGAFAGYIAGLKIECALTA